MKYLKNIFNEIVFGNYFIAACALAMIFATDIINHLPLNFTPVTIFVTSSTHLLYNFHRHSFYIDYANMKSIVGSVKKIRLRFSEKAGYVVVMIIALISRSKFFWHILCFVEMPMWQDL